VGHCWLVVGPVTDGTVDEILGSRTLRKWFHRDEGEDATRGAGKSSTAACRTGEHQKTCERAFRYWSEYVESVSKYPSIAETLFGLMRKFLLGGCM
jgi:hypothetical protein